MGRWQKWLPRNEAALAAGILLGDGSLFSTRLKEDFRRAGISHIVVASGYNVTVAGAALMTILAKWVGRRAGMWAGLAGVWGYVMLSGSGSAVIRAGIMGTIVILGLTAGRKSDSLWSLVLAGVGMLMWRPEYVSDIGWQLSMAATAGLILGATGAGDGLKGLLKQTAAAYVATTPIILINFGQMSVIGPVINVLVLPVVPLVMGLTAMVTMVGMVWSDLGRVGANLAWPVLAYIVKVAQVGGGADFAVWRMGEISWGWGIGYYVLIGLIWILRKR